MKKLVIPILLLIFSLGCTSKKENRVASGPLKEIKDYQVIPMLFSSEITNKDALFDCIVDTLKTLGEVHVVTGCMSEALASTAVLIISLDRHEDRKKGSIKIFAEAEVIANGYKSSCDLWTTSYRDPTSVYPVDTGNGILFRKDEMAKSPDMEVMAGEMIAEFAKQYRQDNPGSRPSFQIYKDFFLNLCASF